ncbi:hypothetical protein TNCT_482131 [Trichonephila clavata]|uniref:Uncharacterized protein n=1 Tax=Trichonephila clavata TaxID=2740835 RepID=A0A8X6IZV7_TRICU|nr:hypothetical protein TNCT_482131 [Trichonephila clavata]
MELPIIRIEPDKFIIPYSFVKKNFMELLETLMEYSNLELILEDDEIETAIQNIPQDNLQVNPMPSGSGIQNSLSPNNLQVNPMPSDKSPPRTLDEIHHHGTLDETTFKQDGGNRPGFQNYGNFNQSEPLNRRLPQDMELFQYNILKKYMDHYVRHGWTNIRLHQDTIRFMIKIFGDILIHHIS